MPIRRAMELPTQILIFAGSLVAIIALSALAWALKLGGPPALGNDDEVRDIAGEVEDGFAAGEVLLDREGASALVRGADGRIMVIKRHGNKFAGRVLEPGASASHAGETVTIDTGERRYGNVRLSHPHAASWASAINRLKTARDA